MQSNHLIHKNPIRYSCHFPAVYAEVSKNEIIIAELLLVILMFCFGFFGGEEGLKINLPMLNKVLINKTTHSEPHLEAAAPLNDGASIMALRAVRLGN